MSEGPRWGARDRSGGGKALFLFGAFGNQFGNQGAIPDQTPPRWICVQAQLLPSTGATSQLSPEPGQSVCLAGSSSPALRGGKSRELPMLELPGPIPGSPGIPPCPFAPLGPMPPGPLSPGPTPLGTNPGIPGKFPGKPGTTGSPSMQSLRYSSERKQGFASSAQIPCREQRVGPDGNGNRK